MKRARCWQCHEILELDVGRPVGRSETCPECDADIRACRSCSFWDNETRTCREPTAEVPADAERRNFCGSFALAAESPASSPGFGAMGAALTDAETAKARLEALFKK